MQPIEIADMERELITRLFEDDLELARLFNANGMTGPARQHVLSALKMLELLEELSKPQRH